MQELRARLIRFEGYIDHLYFDTEGNLTGGVGHNFSAKGIPPRVLNNFHTFNWVFNAFPTKATELLLDCDIEDCFIDLVDIFSIEQFGCKNRMCVLSEINLSEALFPKKVIYVLVDMMFNMGKVRFLGFKNMIKAVHVGDWIGMANEIKDSYYWRKNEEYRLELVACGSKTAYNRAQENINLLISI